MWTPSLSLLLMLKTTFNIIWTDSKGADIAGPSSPNSGHITEPEQSTFLINLLCQVSKLCFSISAAWVHRGFSDDVTELNNVQPGADLVKTFLLMASRIKLECLSLLNLLAFLTFSCKAKGLR